MSKYLDKRWAAELFEGIFVILSRKSMLGVEAIVSGKEEQMGNLRRSS